MTFAILGADPARGLAGVAQATAPIAVGSRCPRVVPGVGVAVSQGNTQPGLSYAMLDALQRSRSAPDAMRDALAADPFPDMRQLAVMAHDGSAAAHSGASLVDWAGHHVEPGFAVIGNGLAGPNVVPAIVAAWRSSSGMLLEERLVAALTAGRDCGGDKNGHQSAVLLVADMSQRWPRTDLRVDWSPGSPDAVDRLSELTDQYAPMIPYYAARAQDPHAPDYDTWLATRMRAS
jgi:uncharacterized Ntn-hydrolase superfamily protein